MKCCDTECKCACHRWNTTTDKVAKVKKIKQPKEPRPQTVRSTRTYAPSLQYRPMTDEDLEATEHGTYNGYRWHVRHAVAPCEPCRQANAAYMNAHRARSRQPGQRYRERLLPVAEIKELFNSGASVSSLARQYDADRRTINSILGRGSMRNARRGHELSQPPPAQLVLTKSPGTGD